MNTNTEIDEEFREACCNGNTDLVKKLVNEGVNVNSQNKMNGWTSLHWSSKRGHAAVVSTLLASKADPSLKNHKGESAIDVAGNDEVKNILQKGLIQESDSNLPMNKKSNSSNDCPINVPLEGQINFIPSYLKYPVFPHTKSTRTENSSENLNPNLIENLSKNKQINSANYRVVEDDDELVLKVRLVNCSDFIEVELDLNGLSFDNLLNVCCAELNVDRKRVTKIRKLPNTLIRKDKDVKRLKEFQELELEVEE